MNLLIVEDEVQLADALAEILQRNKYHVDTVYNGEDGLHYASTGIYDCIVLDIMLPILDGISVLRMLRKQKISTPVLLLTAKSDVADKINGLDSGADDYLTKPFGINELLARVNSHLRRYNRYREAIASAEPVKDTYHVLGGIELNEETVEVFVDGAPVRLTPIEFKILLLLMRNPGRVFPQTKFTNASGMKKRSILTRLWFMSVKSEKK